MPVLINPKHEKYAQELAKGKSQTEAYELAGYKPDGGAACRLSKNVNIQARISEILERRSAKTEITVESLKDMLLEDRQLARQLGQSAAAVSAVDKLGKLYGHMVERKEVGRPGDFSRMSEDELEAFIASGQNIARGSDSRETSPDYQAGMRKPRGLH